jgi:hypothetical protein
MRAVLTFKIHSETDCPTEPTTSAYTPRRTPSESTGGNGDDVASGDLLCLRWIRRFVRVVEPHRAAGRGHVAATKGTKC